MFFPSASAPATYVTGPSTTSKTRSFPATSTSSPPNALFLIPSSMAPLVHMRLRRLRVEFWIPQLQQRVGRDPHFHCTLTTAPDLFSHRRMPILQSEAPRSVGPYASLCHDTVTPRQGRGYISTGPIPRPCSIIR